MNESFRQTVIDYILSGHAYLHAHTPEKTRFISELKDIAADLPEKGRPVYRLVTSGRLAGCGRRPGHDGGRHRTRAAQPADRTPADP
jgi:hypothetical protein